MTDTKWEKDWATEVAKGITDDFSFVSAPGEESRARCTERIAIALRAARDRGLEEAAEEVGWSIQGVLEMVNSGDATPMDVRPELKKYENLEKRIRALKGKGDA